MYKVAQILLLLLVPFTYVYGQSGVAKVVTMGEFVVSAGLENFSATDFIDQIQKDSSFYQAFINLRYYAHDIKGALVVYEKDATEQGSMQRAARQYLNAQSEMWVEINHELTNGKIKKRNGEWKYLTAEMYDDVFFPTAPEKVSNKIVTTNQELDGRGLEKHKAQLKKMMFNPGAEIANVPFIGDKMAIFSDEMIPFYTYSIFTQVWGADSIPCIVFSCYVKEGMEKEVVIRDMTSYFHSDTREVIARDYRLAAKTILFDFDISMKVENVLKRGLLLPAHITYNGYWDVPFKKPEIVSFQLACSNYDLSP